MQRNELIDRVAVVEEDNNLLLKAGLAGRLENSESKIGSKKHRNIQVLLNPEEGSWRTSNSLTFIFQTKNHHWKLARIDFQSEEGRGGGKILNRGLCLRHSAQSCILMKLTSRDMKPLKCGWRQNYSRRDNKSSEYTVCSVQKP